MNASEHESLHIEHLVWKKCKFAGCERTAGGNCEHCGFHPGELWLHSVEIAQSIIDVSTVQGE